MTPEADREPPKSEPCLVALRGPLVRHLSLAEARKVFPTCPKARAALPGTYREWKKATGKVHARLTW